MRRDQGTPSLKGCWIPSGPCLEVVWFFFGLGIDVCIQSVQAWFAVIHTFISSNLLLISPPFQTWVRGAGEPSSAPLPCSFSSRCWLRKKKPVPCLLLYSNLSGGVSLPKTEEMNGLCLVNQADAGRRHAALDSKCIWGPVS